MRSTRGAVVAVIVVAAGVLGVPSLSMAQAQVPTQDSVRATGNAPNPITAGGYFNLDFDVQSDPTGGNVSGHGSMTLGAPDGLLVQGPATCLKVDGNTAYVEINSDAFGPVTSKLVDGGPAGSGLDRFNAFLSDRTSTNCGFNPVFDDVPVNGGDVVVVDAPPLPTSKDQCKNGGYSSFGFKNQGECVAFVQRGPKPKP